ncbi:MAG: formylglycine-generating enzyme family protein [Blastocatellia bacterium]|nr:formylglycine-generating enzyme family protein [Blastocatellia bacterium]
MDDLYEYVSNQVKSESSQKPMKWALGVEGKSLVISRSIQVFKEKYLDKLHSAIVNQFNRYLTRDVFKQAVALLLLEASELTREQKEQILLIDRLIKEKIEPGDFLTQWPKLMGQVPFPEKPLVRNIQAAPEVSTPTLPDKTIIKLKEFEFKTPILNRRGEQVKVLSGKAKYYEEDLGNGIVLEMVQIPGGSFLMGTNEKDVEKIVAEYTKHGRDKKDAHKWVKSETPQHRVIVPSFYMGKYQVTQEQWKAVMGDNPSRFKGNRLPVESISWEQAKEFCKKLSEKTGKEYRLPSEAEWEYACRVGAFGETITPEIVNYDGNYPYANAPKGEYREKTVEVGSLGVANQFGLYDMHGNVWEWCEDVWHGNYDSAPDDGSAWVTGGDANFHVVRGGSWDNHSSYCRSAHRGRWPLAIYVSGFRVVVLSRTL